MGRRGSSPLCATSAVGLRLTPVVFPRSASFQSILPYTQGLPSICMGHGFPYTHVHGTWVSIHTCAWDMGFHAHMCMGHGFPCTHVHGTWVSMHTCAWDMGFHAHMCMGHGFPYTHVHGTWVSIHTCTWDMGFHTHTCMGHGFPLCISGWLSLNHRANRNTIQGFIQDFRLGGTIFCVSVKCRIWGIWSPPLPESYENTILGPKRNG